MKTVHIVTGCLLLAAGFFAGRVSLMVDQALPAKESGAAEGKPLPDGKQLGPSLETGQNVETELQAFKDDEVTLDELRSLVDPGSWGSSAAKVHLAISGLSVEALRSFMAEFHSGLPGKRNDGMLRSIIFGRYAELAPKEALAFTADPRNENAAELMSTAMGMLARSDPGAALEEFRKLSAFEKQRAAAGLIRAVDDPFKVVRLLEQEPDLIAGESAWILDEFFGRWVDTDPEAAVRSALALSHPDGRRQAVAGIANSWSKSDPQAAVAWAEQLRNPALRDAAVKSVIHTLALSDPQGAIELIAKTGGELNFGTSTMIAKSWYHREPEAALQWIHEVSDPVQKSKLLESIAWRIGQDDPVRAIALAEGQPPGTSRLQLMRAAVSGLSSTDPARALELADSLESPRDRKRAIAGVMWSWTQQDPSAAAERMAEISEPDLREDVAGTIAGAWAAKNRDAALAWVNRLSGAEFDAAVGSLLSAVNQQNPIDASRIFSELAADGNTGASAGKTASLIARSWAQSDPVGAANWAMSLSDGRGKEEAVSSVVSSWARYDPATASEWIVQLPEGEGRDGAAGNLVDAITEDDPESAFIWAGSIRDPSLKLSSLKQSVRQWKERDPGAATRAVEAADDLPGPMRRELLNLLSAED